MIARPKPPVDVDAMPYALRREDRWVLWRYDWDGKRWTKRPYQVDGGLARSNYWFHWTSFEKARQVYRTTGSFDGIGFVLGDGWAGIDLDKCVTDYNPETTTEAAGRCFFALHDIYCYWEISPSGTGYKAIGRSARVGGEINFSTDPPKVTVWQRPRFFAMTGYYRSAVGSPEADLTPIIDAWFPAPVNLSSTREGYSLAAESSDDDLLIAAVANGTNGNDFLSLWRGETDAYGKDHSRADQALVNHLAFWCNYDMERVDRLFRQSGLYRPKWDHASYRRATLGKACR